MRLSIIIPVYNEVGTVRKVLRRVAGVRVGGVRKEVIVVDERLRFEEMPINYSPMDYR